MSARFRSSDGRTVVDVIRLSLTNRGDGERFRVCRDGFYMAEVRTMTELAALVDLDDLAEA